MKNEVKKEKPNDVKHLVKIFQYARPYKILACCSFGITIAFAGLVPIRPWVTQHVFDHFIATPNLHKLFTFTILLIFLLILEGVFQFTDALLSSKLGQCIVKDIRTDLYKNLLKRPIRFFDNTPNGTIITRLVSDIETIGDIFSQGLMVIIGDLLKIVVIITVMASANGILTLISLATLPILMLATYWFKNAINITFNLVRTQVARLNTFVQEHLTGLFLIQVFNRENIDFEEFKSINQEHRDANIKSIWYYSLFFPVVEILSSVSLGLLLWAGGFSYLKGVASLGQLISFIMYINMLFRPIRMLADRFNTLQMGIISSKRVFAWLETPTQTLPSGQLSGNSILGNVAFENVYFRYNQEDSTTGWILNNISFQAPNGSVTALVGETGSGKTSIINLLIRFYEFEQGRILIDGSDIREYKVADLRASIGIVTQDVFLFSDSIFNNIILGNPSCSKEDVIHAAKEIGAHSFIMNLPGGYDYQVKERGSSLSMGQRQLISFIRTFILNPRILILDEATSSIDAESEQLIQRATERLMQNRTSIVIAHRLGTIKKADQILVIHRGEIVEQGTHVELLGRGGKYRKLFDSQFKEVNS